MLNFFKMAKEVSKVVKLQVKGGAANPSPPVGPALGAAGVNIMEFCKQFNARTQKQMGELTPVVITIYKDRTFTFEVKTPPVSYLLMKAAGLEKGSSEPNKIKVAVLSKKQISEIAKQKMVDLNANDENGAVKIVAGTARSMGIDIRD